MYVEQEDQLSNYEHSPLPTSVSTSNELNSFEDLKLRPEIISTLKGMGFQAPTEVQKKTIPHAVRGKDLLVQSHTGSGKTAAFGIPFAQGLVDPFLKEPQALVLCPTRELAIQVAQECTTIATSRNLTVIPIYGGAAIGPQIQALREGAQIIVGTPGRILEHLRRGNLKAETIQILVLDECDEMLSMGFYEELSAIMEQLPEKRQTMLFSATIPDEIQKMAESYLKDPVRLYLSEDFIGVRDIHHVYYLISGGDRQKDLLQVLNYENPRLGIIFCNTREETASLSEFLRSQGFRVEGTSSDLTQAERERVMRQVRNGELQFLVATDVAARGIDVADVTHVFNYTFPESADIYIHRTGRTGRAGKSGIAVSLVSPREIGSFYYLKLIHKIIPEERHLPSAEEIAARREGEHLETLHQLFADKVPTEEMRHLARRVLSMIDGERYVALALATVVQELQEHQPGVKELGSFPTTRTTPSSEREPTLERPSRSRARNKSSEIFIKGESATVTTSREGGGGKPSSGKRPTQELRPRERKTVRTRRPESEHGSFVTPDGDVEHWEILDDVEIPGGGEESAASVRLFVNLGRRQGARPASLIDFITREAALAESQLEDVQVRDSFSYINVRFDLADSVITRLTGKSFRDRMIRVERAKK